MLRYSKIEEALAFLSDKTRRIWTESELFELATYLELELTAVAPASACTIIFTLKPGEGLVEEWRSSPGHALFAVLFPFQVMQIWMRGETTTAHPLDHAALHLKPKLFVEPVLVTPAEVRISQESLQQMWSAWERALNGDDEDFPPWMQPKPVECLRLGTVPLNQAGDSLQQPIFPTGEASAVDVGLGMGENENKWDEFALRRLMAEAQEPGATQQKLASLYGVSRQFIGKQLKKGREAFSPRKAGYADSLKR